MFGSKDQMIADLRDELSVYKLELRALQLDMKVARAELELERERAERLLSRLDEKRKADSLRKYTVRWKNGDTEDYVADYIRVSYPDSSAVFFLNSVLVGNAVGYNRITSVPAGGARQ